MERLILACLALMATTCVETKTDVYRKAYLRGAFQTPPPETTSQPSDGPTDASTGPHVRELPGGITATTCRNKHNWQSFGDRESKYAFCENLGSVVAICERPFDAKTPQEVCEYQWATQDRRVEVAEECMQLDIDVSQVPAMIDTIDVCKCGEQYLSTKACYWTSCLHQIACLREAGFQWTSKAPTRTDT